MWQWPRRSASALSETDPCRIRRQWPPPSSNAAVKYRRQCQTRDLTVPTGSPGERHLPFQEEVAGPGDKKRGLRRAPVIKSSQPLPSYWQTRLEGGPLLQLPLQQSPSFRQELPVVVHGGHATGSPEQSESSQSVAPSQSLSTPSPQTSTPMQSRAQLLQVSPESQTASPQQNESGMLGTVVQVFPWAVQRLSPQKTGLVPSPSPQQYRLDGRPL